MGGDLRCGLGHAIAREHWPAKCPSCPARGFVESAATDHDRAEALRCAVLTCNEIMHLRGHERGVGDLKIGNPACEGFRLPTRREMFEAAACGKRACGNTEAADMMDRQREAPTGICRHLKMCIHRIGRDSQRIFTQHDPLRRSAAARCFKKHLRAKFGQIRYRIHETTRRTWRGVVPKIAMHQ